MPLNIEVLIPNEQTRKSLGAIRFAHFVSKPGRGKSCSMAVAWLADLDREQGRRDLENLCAAVRRDVPVVLMSERRAAPQSDSAFQALAHLTWLVDREVYIAPDARAVARMVRARQAKAEAKLIASAAVEDGKLVVWTCEPRRYAVATSDVPALAELTPGALTNFEVSESGSRIRWKDGRVDLNLDVIRAYADPDVRRQHEAAHRKEAVRYAGAIRRLREDRGLTQSGVAGLSERQVRRLEEGDTIPHSSTLKKLATAHGMSIQDYLRELAKRSGSRAQGRSAPRRARRRPAARG